MEIELSKVSLKLEAISEKNHRLFLSGYLVVSLLALVWMLYRIRFGVDFTDEAYYAAFSWVYEFGSSPFREDINFHHTMGILLWPLVKIFRLFSDDSDGIVIFFRYMFVLLNGICAIAIFTELKKNVPTSISFLFALSVFLYVPMSVPSLSYNNLGVVLSLLTLVLSQSSRPWTQATSGIISIIASLAYPSLILPFLIWVILRFFTNAKGVKFYIIGFSAASAVACGLFLHFGLSNILASLHATKELNLQSPPMQKILQLINEMREPLLKWLPFFAFSLFFLWKRKLIEFFLSLVALAYVYELISNSSPIGLVANLGFYYTSTAAGLALAVYFWVYFRRNFGEFVFSMLACFMMGFTSANASFNFAFLVPAIILAIVLTIRKETSFILKSSIVVLLIFNCAYNVHSFSQFVYRDETPFTELTTEIETGPFKGMYTSKEKHKFLADIQNNLNRFLTPSVKSVAFFDDFPAGYLMTTRQAKTRAIWMSPDPRINRNIFLSVYKTTEDLPDLVYVINEGFYTIGLRYSYPSNEPVRKFFETLIKNGTYSAFNVTPTQWVLVKKSLL